MSEVNASLMSCVPCQKWAIIGVVVALSAYITRFMPLHRTLGSKAVSHLNAQPGSK